MRFIDYIAIAFRNIRRQKLRSALTIFAVVIGATSVTIMLALVTGAKSFFTSQFESTGQLQQIIVTQATDLDYDHARWGGNNSESGVKLDEALITKIKQSPHVVEVARTTYVHVFDYMLYNDKKYTLNNTPSADANGVISHEVLAGRDLTATDGKGTILIGKKYADKFGFNKKYDQVIGQKVKLVTQNFFSGEGAEITPPPQNGNPSDRQDQKPTTFEATIVGVVEDEEAVIFPLSWAKGLLQNRRYDVPEAERQAFDQARQAAEQAGRNGQRVSQPTPPQPKLVVDSELDKRGYNTLVVKADSTSNVEDVAKNIRTLGVGAATAKDYVASQIQIFNILGYVLGGIGGIALAVAAIGVVNTMVMAILERTREIGVMRAVGAKRATVRRLFTFEASMLGFWGGVFGVAVGYGLTRVANIFINKQLASNGVKTTNIIGLPVWLILAVIGIATLIGMLAGLYPAHRAAKLNPVDALRYE